MANGDIWYWGETFKVDFTSFQIICTLWNVVPSKLTAFCTAAGTFFCSSLMISNSKFSGVILQLLWFNSMQFICQPTNSQKVFSNFLWYYEMKMNRLYMTCFSLNFSNMQLWAGGLHLLTENCCCTSLARCLSLHTTDLLLEMISL